MKNRHELPETSCPEYITVWGKRVDNPDAERPDAPRCYTLHVIAEDGCTLKVSKMPMGLAVAACRVSLTNTDVYRAWVTDDELGAPVQLAKV